MAAVRRRSATNISLLLLLWSTSACVPPSEEDLNDADEFGASEGDARGVAASTGFDCPQAGAADPNLPPIPTSAVERQWTVAPRATDVADSNRTIREGYPPLLRDAGVRGMTEVWLYVNDQGQVDGTDLCRSSGHPELDETALSAARLMEFAPAQMGDSTVGVWLWHSFDFGLE